MIEELKKVSRPLRIEYPGAFYHVTSRGDERKMALSFDEIGAYLGMKAVRSAS